MNRAGARLIGRPVDEIQGRTVDDLLPPELAESMAQADRRVLQTQQPVIRKQTAVPLGGEERWLIETKFPVIGLGGESMVGGISVDMTEQMRLMHDLEAQSNFVSKIAEMIPYLLYVFDLTQGFNVYVNPYTERFFGLTLEELQQKGQTLFLDTLHPEELNQLEKWNIRWDQAQDGQVFENEFRLLNAQGEYRWLHCYETVFNRDAQGRPVQILGSCIDITADKENKAALLDSEARYRAVVESAPNLIVVIQEGRHVYANWAAAQAMGFDHPSQLIGVSVLDVLAPTSHALALQRLDAALQGEANPPRRFDLLRQDGTIRHIETSSVSISVEGKSAVLSIGVDITQRLQAQQQIEQLQRAQTALLHAVQESMVLIDREGVILACNEAFAIRIDQDLQSMLGKNAFGFFSPDVAERRREQIDKVVESRQLLRMQDVRGPYRTDNVIYPILNAVGDVIQLAIFGRDITQEYEARREIERMQEFLQMTNEVAYIGGWAYDLETGKGEVTPVTNRIVGVDTVKDISWSGGISFFSAERQAAITQIFEQTVRTGRPFDLEEELLRPDGASRWVRIIGHPQLTDGKVTHIKGAIQDITAYRGAVEALRASDARFRSVLETIQLIGLMLDSQGRVIFCNDYGLKLLGYRREEVLGKDWFQNFLPSDVARSVVSIFEEMIQTGQMPVYYENSILTVSGEQRLIAWHNVAFYDSKGQVIEVTSIGQDITEQKMIQSQLQETSERLQAVIQASPLAIVGADRERRVTVWNLAAERLFGWTAAEITGKPLPYVPSTEEEEVDNLSQKVALGLHLIEVDVIRKNRDGRLIPLRLSTAPLYDKDGTVSGGIAIFTDISERKQFEDELRRLYQAIEQIPMTISISDSDRVIRYVNPHFEFLTGYSAAEAIGHPTRDLLDSGEHGQEVYEKMAQTIQDQGKWQGEFHNRRKNGELYWEAVLISGVRDQEGQLTHYIRIGQDITEQKEQAESQRQQERLAAVGQLAAGIAHDFNNILAVIGLYSQLLQRDPAIQGKVKAQLGTIVQQTEQAAELIQQILDFSRQSVLERKVLNLVPLVKEAIKLLDRTLPETIRISLICSQDRLYVRADPTRMQQMLMNLCVNARDAMPDGGQLTVHLSSVAAHDQELPESLSVPSVDWVCISITDTGEGIAPELIHRIFDPFFTTKGPGKGTGLGLAQVYGIAKQHDGDVQVESRVGEGSTFRVYLPRTEESQLHLTGQEPDQILEGRGECILVVEDNPFTQTALVDILDGLGYRVLTAGSGREALTLIEQTDHQIDLILSDVVMPEMGGPQLLAELRQRQIGTRVIMLSGHPKEESVESIQAQGIFAWLTKPPDLAILAETIRAALL